MKVKRSIVKIHEDKCTGCGKCVDACVEGAIRMIDGKARLVSESYCDGLGACIGECPYGAIEIIEAEAEPFDEEAVKKHLAAAEDATVERVPEGGGEGEPSLASWPLQLKLLSVSAEFLREKPLAVCADCVAFAHGDVRGLTGAEAVLVIACPKLDGAVDAYVEKLAEIFSLNRTPFVRVFRMEVPCCSGLTRIVEAAVRKSGRDVPLEEVIVSIRGEVL